MPHPIVEPRWEAGILADSQQKSVRGVQTPLGAEEGEPARGGVTSNGWVVHRVLPFRDGNAVWNDQTWIIAQFEVYEGPLSPKTYPHLLFVIAAWSSNAEYVGRDLRSLDTRTITDPQSDGVAFDVARVPQACMINGSSISSVGTLLPADCTQALSTACLSCQPWFSDERREDWV